MSVAFTREDSAETAAETQLPDRPVSPHPNLVTASGLQALQLSLEQARRDYEAAQKIEDINERRRISAPALRDARYFAERLGAAQLVSLPASTDVVAFGHRVTFSRNAKPNQTYRIVGEDEADPQRGTISYVAPLARLLMGKAVGDVAMLGDEEIEIIAVLD
jgi:transcription elongation GreA/GreB family factor